jgi:aryl-alcohol dehydrogenase-like predicted oxidoreductase
VSNYSLERWREAEAALGGPVLSNQVRYSLVHRGIEADVLPWAQANDRVVIAYSPLAQGLLSGRYDVDHRPGGMRGGTSTFLPENLARFAPLLEVLRQLADAHRATCAQVALAWLLRRPNVVVIPGASSVAQAESNAAAAELELTDDQDQALTAASDAYQPTVGVAALGPLVRTRADGLAARVRRAVEGTRS